MKRERMRVNIAGEYLNRFRFADNMVLILELPDALELMLRKLNGDGIENKWEDESEKVCSTAAWLARAHTHTSKETE